MTPLVQTAVSLFGTPQGASLSTTTAAPTLIGETGGSAVAASASGPAPFADLLTEAVGQVGQLEAQARSAVEGLMAGTGVDVHEAMIATEKAEMGFELVLSVRNKALAAYQQVMGMQF